MTRILALIFIFVCTFNVSAVTFGDAGDLYQKGKYKEALSHYRTLEKSSNSWKLYYNMGNCCFKLKQYLQAKIYYLKAEKLNPVNDDIKFNLNITDRYFKDKIPEVKSDFIDSVIGRINNGISLNSLSYMLILVIVLLNASVISFIIKRIDKRVIIYAGTICLIMAIALSSYHIYRVDLETSRSVGVVMKDGVTLYSGPGSDNTALFEVNSGLKLRVSGESSGWYQVSASDEIAGWINAEDMEKL